MKASRSKDARNEKDEKYMGIKNMDNELFSPEEMQSPFEAIKETDAEGREWWNSRK